MHAHRATLDAAVRHPLAARAIIQGTLPANFANTASGTLRTLFNIGSNLASRAEGCHLVVVSGVMDQDGATHHLAVHLVTATSAHMTAGPALAARAAVILHVTLILISVLVTTDSASSEGLPWA